MIDDKHIDESISRLVQEVQLDIPPAVEEAIHRRSAALRPRLGHICFSRFFWTLVSSGAALILGVILLMRTPTKPAISEISEIRTQFEIADKNITIVFIQKPDFLFFKEN
jgi:hypothetical protein